MVAADTARAWSHPSTVLPEPARAELARRREQLLARSTGTILDLDAPGVAERFVAVGATRIDPDIRRAAPGLAPEVDDLAPPGPDGRYDTVVATGVLGAFPDLGAVTSALAGLVAGNGALLFVEPVGEPGWIPLLRTSVPSRGALGAPWQALHLDRDVPAAVRAAGLVVCDLDRGVLPDLPPSLRHWVSGRAVRIVVD